MTKVIIDVLSYLCQGNQAGRPTKRNVLPVYLFVYYVLMFIFIDLEVGCCCSQRRSEELARAEGEQLEGIGTASSNSANVSFTAGARASPSLPTAGSGGQGQPIAASGSGLGGGDAVAYMEDYDTSIPTLNTVSNNLSILLFCAGYMRSFQPIDGVEKYSRDVLKR
jgi:hypothetical protein